MITAAISYSFLQHYWWALIALLGALLVFLLFVQGGQTLIYRLGKTDAERSILVNILGRKWELTFTTLVTFGGAFFASFPLFYSTSFGGAYWVWIAILLCFVLQAVAYEYRTKPGNVLGKRTYETFLAINGFGGTFLLGVAVATFFTGSAFSMEKENLTNIFGENGGVTISQWQGAAHGLEAALNIQNVLLGLAVCFLARTLGCLYFINSIDNNAIYDRAKKQLLYNALPFVVFFIVFVIMLLTQSGFAVKPETQEVFMEPYKYLHNLLQMPVVLILFLVGVVGVLAGIFIALFKQSTKGIWFSGAGTILTVFALLLIAGYNHTAYYPSTYNLQHSLTIENSSSSYFTLKVMSVVSLFIPAVLAYIWWAWTKMNKKKMTEEEIGKEDAAY